MLRSIEAKYVSKRNAERQERVWRLRHCPPDFETHERRLQTTSVLEEIQKVSQATNEVEIEDDEEKMKGMNQMYRPKLHGDV